MRRWRRWSRRLARGLQALGVTPGDRVALVAENRPEWAIADLAIMAAGGISVPAFTTNTPSDHRHVLTHSGAKGVILSTKAMADRVLPAALEAHELGFIVTIDELPLAQRIGKRVITWEEAQAVAPAEGAESIDSIAARLTRADVACFIYTSGTGGTPKGVMLTHGSILCNCRGAYHLLKELGVGDEVFLCFLPLSHSYEHTVGQLFPISIGAQIYYAESIEKLSENMAEARPTIMTAVPRLYEAMHQRILRGIAKASPLQRRMFDMAVTLGRKRCRGGIPRPRRAHRAICWPRSPCAARSGSASAGGSRPGSPAGPPSIRRSGSSSSLWACRCSRAMARPRPRR